MSYRPVCWTSYENIINSILWFSLGFLAFGFVGVIYAFYRLVDQAESIAFDTWKVETQKVEAERSLRREAEKRVSELEAQRVAASKAIEASSLPWFPKNDRLEARFEADAMDKIENPVVSWDSIPGLGGTDGS